jgi:predicted methyltransferase
MLPFPCVHLFSLTLFLSAALAFVVQPLIAKRLLPLLGGSPAVWNTCLVFFQATLLAGYALSDRMVRLRPRAQVKTHLALLLLAGAAALYGWLAPLGAPATGASPTAWLLGTLATTVGIPFLVLSVNSTLLQRWFSLSGATDDPYSLYRASNLGSLLGLLAFPFLFEPLLTLTVQGALWVFGFVLLMAMVAACGRKVLTGHSGLEEARSEGGAPSHIAWTRKLLWVLVAFVPASLTIGVTTYISTDLAAVPLLWVLPLALYLLSFAITFGPKPATRFVAAAGWAYPVLAVTVLACLHRVTTFPVSASLALHPALLLSVGLLAHGFLASDRPDASQLTQFYLFIAVGGVLGGAFNALIAPQIFSTIVEYPLVITLAAFVLPLAHYGKASSLVDAALGITVALIAMATTAFALRTYGTAPIALVVIFALPTVLCLMFRRRWLRLGTAMAGLLLVTVALPSTAGRVLYRARTFFGALRVTAENGNVFHVLRHGTTTHGRQDRRGAVRRRVPVSYYNTKGPIGQLIGGQRAWKRPLRIGVVGLGTGTMAAYAMPGDTFVFYEIDPEVVRIAQTPAWFSFLSESAVKPTIVMGDARLSLARESPQNFDVILLDAFSSDSIPVHLVTEEAFAVYKHHLGQEGVIVTHVSNRHLELRSVIASTAQAAGLTSVEQIDSISGEMMAQGYASSRWVVSGTREALAANGMPSDRWTPSQLGARPWTDDYSNLASVIVWRR